MIPIESRRPAPAAVAPRLPARPRCALDRHLGPFEPVAELRGFLAADWVECRCCGAPVTLATAARARFAA